MGEYSPAKTGEYPRIFPNFQNCARCVKDLKDNKDNSLHLGRKYARIFVLGHYLFLVAHSFPRATLSENCSLLGTYNVRGQISEHIFAPNGGYCLYIFAPNGGYCLYIFTPNGGYCLFVTLFDDIKSYLCFNSLRPFIFLSLPYILSGRKI